MTETAVEILPGIEIRLVEDPGLRSPGRLTGVLMAYEAPANTRRERFARGSLRWSSAGIVVNRRHDAAAPIVRTVPRDLGDRVVIDVDLPDTTAGRDAAAEVRSGLMRGLSVEFVARAEHRDAAGVRVIDDAELRAAGLVDSPDYSRATVEVRSERSGALPWL